MGRTTRSGILVQLELHHRTGTNAMKDDTALAEELGLPLDEIQGELEILESLGHVKLAKAFAPPWGAVITPAGRLNVEDLLAPIRDHRPIGFGAGGR